MNKKTILLAVLCALVSAQSYAISTKKSVAAIDQRLARIEQLLQSQGLLDMLQQLESLQQEVNRLRGEIEVQNHTLEQLNKRQRALYADIDQRLQQLDSNDPQSPEITSATPAAKTTAPEDPPLQTLAPLILDRPPATSQQTDSPLTVELLNNASATAAPPAAASASNTRSALIVATRSEITASEIPTVAATEQAGPATQANPIQARTDYQQAFKLLKQSLYDQAIKAFNEFLTLHPDSDYSDNARYWLGEAYYVSHQFEQALREYNKLVADYPQSQKLTHALLKIGYSNHELGNIQEALALLEDLQQKYPGTTAARLATEREQKIRAAQQQGATN